MGALASLAVPVAAGVHYDHSKFSYSATNTDQKVDPVSFVAYGPKVNADGAQVVVTLSVGWGESAGSTGGQFAKDHGVWSEFDRNNADDTNANDRNHVRWNSSEPEGLGHDNYIYAAGTPHHEQFVVGQGCGFPGKHAVDSFIDGRENLKDGLLDDKDFPWFYRHDGSTTMVRQCNEDLIGNDGTVVWMRLRPEPDLAASRGASDRSAWAAGNAEPIAVTQAVGRACETDDVPNFDHYFLGAQFDGLSLTGRRRSCEPPPAVVRSD